MIPRGKLYISYKDFKPDVIPDSEDLTLDNLVYLPVYPAMSNKDRNKLTHEQV
jgi:hypothetical protein